MKTECALAAWYCVVTTFANSILWIGQLPLETLSWLVQ